VITFSFTGHRRGLRIAVHAAVLAVWAIVGAAVLSLDDAAELPIVLWALSGAALLVVRRDVGPLRFQRRFELYRIAAVRAVRLPGLLGGSHRVEFRYDGRTRRFGCGLSSREADCIIGLLHRAIRTACEP